jgi:hypothetical protein
VRIRGIKKNIITERDRDMTLELAKSGLFG